MTDPTNDRSKLIAESSFGALGARRLAERTPDDVAAAILHDLEDAITVGRVARGATDSAMVNMLAVGSVAVRGGTAYAVAGGAWGSVPGASDVEELPWPSNSLLGRLRDRTRQELLNIGTIVRYSADREIIEQDAQDNHVLLLLDGVVKVQVTTETGDTALLAIRTAGDVVGEMAALDQKPRSAAVVTCVDVTAKLITSGEFMSFLHRRNDVFVELIAVINDRLRWANQRRRDFLSHSAAERVARVLAELVQTYGREERHGWTLGIPLNKYELASIAGLKPRTAEKAFSDMRKAGVVVSHLRRDILIPDLQALRRFAGIY